jgi:hypothetical protein
MTRPERIHRNRCFGLGVAVVFGVTLAALSWRNWPAVAVAVVGALVALVVFLRDCRDSESKSTQSDPHSRDS